MIIQKMLVRTLNIVLIITIRYYIIFVKVKHKTIFCKSGLDAPAFTIYVYFISLVVRVDNNKP